MMLFMVNGQGVDFSIVNSDVFEPGTSVEVNVNVNGFVDVASMQFSLNWDANVLEFEEIVELNSNLSDLSNSNFGLPSTGLEAGNLRFAWFPFGISSETLAPSSSLFTLKFKVVGEGCDQTVIELGGDSAFPVEISDSQINLIPHTTQNLQVAVLGSDCSPFGGSVDCGTAVEVNSNPFGCSANLDATTINVFADQSLYTDITFTPSTVTKSQDGSYTPCLVSAFLNGVEHTCVVYVKVIDITPPIPVAKQNIVISLTTTPGSSFGNAKLFAQSVDNGSHDGDCGPVRIVIRRTDNSAATCNNLGTFDATTGEAHNNNNTYFNFEDLDDAEQPTDHDINDTDNGDFVKFCNADIDGPLGVDEDGDGENDYALIPVELGAWDDANSDGFVGNEGDLFSSTWATVRLEGKVDFNTTLVCNNMVNISTDPWNCDVTITPDMLLEGGPYDYSVMTVSPSNLDSDDLGILTTVTVTHTPTGNTCWGEVRLEDKTPPVVVFNQKVILTVDQNCQATLNFTDVDNGSYDGCTSIVGSPSSISLNENDLGVHDFMFTVTDENGNFNQSFVTVQLLDGSGFCSGTGQNNDLELILEDKVVAGGTRTCVSLRAKNFRNITSFQGSVQWDPSVAIFDDFSNVNLPGFNPAGGSNLTAIDQGELSFLWFDQTGQTPLSISNNGLLMDFCFDVIGSDGTSTFISLTDDPVVIEAASDNEVFDHIVTQGSITVSGQVDCSNDIKKPTPYCINLSTALTENGSVELWAADFNLGSFDDCTAEPDLRFTFDDLNPSNNPEFDSGANSSKKTFTAIGSVTLQVPIYVWDESDNNDFCMVNVQLVESETGGSGDVEFVFPHVNAAPLNTVCLPLYVNNFKDIVAAQGAVSWDPSVLNYKNVENFGLPGLNEFAFGDGQNGSLNFAWFESSGQSSATLTNGAIFCDVCFDVVGDNGDFSSVKVVDGTPAFIEVVGENNVILEVNSVGGSVTVGDGENCDFTEADIVWPLAVINIDAPTATENNILSLVTPSNLVSIFGFSTEEVSPTFDSDCALVGFTYDDDLFIEVGGNGADTYKIIRSFTVLNWNTGDVYTFDQVIKTFALEDFICDTEPNSFQLGDCDSGHSDTDDVEWPDDLEIADHRILPDELVSISGVDVEDSKPIFYNEPDAYSATYADVIITLEEKLLQFNRCWTVTRDDLPSAEWEYCQLISVDLTTFNQLVTVNTLLNRPVPNVNLVGQLLTDENGSALTEEEVDPSKSDQARNGLNIKDIVMARQYILSGISNGDVDDAILEQVLDLNNDTNLSNLDLTILERIVLGLDNNTSSTWDFIEVPQQNGMGLDVKAHYIGLKPGDIDDTADLDGSSSFERTERLVMVDQVVNNGEFYSVPIYLENGTDTRGLELRLEFDAESIDIIGITSPEFFGNISWSLYDGNKIVMLLSNDDSSSVFVDDITPILNIEIAAKENALLKDLIELSEDDYSFILDEEFRLRAIEGIFEGQIGVSATDLDAQLGFKVYPNPASYNVIIDASKVYESGDYLFELFDVTGQRVLSQFNASRVEVSDVPNGLYIYKLRINDKVQAGRLSVQR